MVGTAQWIASWIGIIVLVLDIVKGRPVARGIGDVEENACRPTKEGISLWHPYCGTRLNKINFILLLTLFETVWVYER
jgi:hypothetical protein